MHFRAQFLHFKMHPVNGRGAAPLGSATGPAVGRIADRTGCHPRSTIFVSSERAYAISY